MKRGIIKERINYYLQNGINDPSTIIDKLRKEFPEENIKSNSVKSYISILKPKKKEENQSSQFENNNSNVNNDSDNINSNSPNAPNPSANTSDLSTSANVEGLQTKEETFETQESEKEITILNKSPINLITATNKFDVSSNEQSVLPEASEIANSYLNQKIEETIDPEQEKKTQIHIDRFGEIAGDGAYIVFNSKAFQKISHGYKLEDKEVKRINEDMGIILKQRVPSVFSEYGDIVNLGGDFARVFLKGLAHRLKTPMPKELEEKFKKSEETVKEVVEETAKQIQKEIKEVSVESEVRLEENQCIGCKQITPQELDKNNRCPNCHFKHTIAELEKHNSS